MRPILKSLLLAGLCLPLYSCLFSDDKKTPAPASGTLKLTASPLEKITITAVYDTVRLTVPAGMTLADSNPVVVRVDAAGNKTGELGKLYDNGSTSNGDDIVGDKVYSGIFYLTDNTVGESRLRVDAAIKSGGAASSNVVSISVYSDFTSQEARQLLNVQDSAAIQLNAFVGGNPANLPAAMNQLNAWLNARPEVDSVEQGEGSFEIRYTSGVWGGLIIAQDSNGVVLTKGGTAAASPRRLPHPTPLSEQTRGTPARAPTGSGAPSSLPKTAVTQEGIPPNIIGNRKVLIYAPFEAAFHSSEGLSVGLIFATADTIFEVTYLENQSANVAALFRLTDYGYVMLDTHGSQGRSFLTGEIADTTASVFKTTYKALLKSGKLRISKNVTVSQVGDVKAFANVYKVNWQFIESLPGKFPNSVIMNSSCESSMNPDLSSTFLEKGAQVYFGYDDIVSTSFSKPNSDSIASRLAVAGLTVQQAFTSGLKDPKSHNAEFEAYANTPDLHYADSLINGDFEFGTMDGWTREGDGRVISQLVNKYPTGGSNMGIISTGLGFTTAKGSIQQTFKVVAGKTTLKLNWNFMSEEFLYYIGSSYQDYFQVVVRGPDGKETVILNKSIDQLAAEFGASKTNAGHLLNDTLKIKFDVDGVYSTGWKAFDYDLSAFAGKRITLILRAEDIGDSIYDTAILLDDVKVE